MSRSPASPARKNSPAPKSSSARRSGLARKKPPHHYHHGDLRRALVAEAVRTIQAAGIDALTLRHVGERLGVSRTAPYRHFADKSALLAAVGLEGFRAFRAALSAAATEAGGGRAGLEAMGRAYVRFAIEHPSHYRVMFGGFLEGCRSEPELEPEGEAAFRLLVDALAAEQRAGTLRHDDPAQMARYVWAIVHGLAMLAIDGQLRNYDIEAEAAYALMRLRSGIAASSAVS